jgi:aldehyde dehydrogenase (NAD+)
LGSDAEVIVSHDPRGVVGLITPWNAPLAIVAWKLAPALAMGNTVVLKPSERAPVSVQSMIRLIATALEDLGAPAGLLSVVNGAAVTGRALAEHPGLDALSFTGGVKAGQALAVEAASRLLPLQLELGGKNAMVVARDADVDRAVALTLSGGFAGAGQKCTATSRVIVEAPIADAFLGALTAKVRSLTTGRADADVFMGPVIDSDAVARVDKVRAGGECLAEGQILAQNGYFAPACLMLDDDPQSWLNQTEQFAPVVSVMRVDNLDAAIAAANATRFGLSSAIVTNSLASARAFRRDSRAGIVAVNQTTSGSDLHAPFEGTGMSGTGGAEQGRQALDFYSRIKTAYILND